MDIGMESQIICVYTSNILVWYMICLLISLCMMCAYVGFLLGLVLQILIRDKFLVEPTSRSLRWDLSSTHRNRRNATEPSGNRNQHMKHGRNQRLFQVKKLDQEMTHDQELSTLWVDELINHAICTSLPVLFTHKFVPCSWETYMI